MVKHAVNKNDPIQLSFRLNPSKAQEFQAVSPTKKVEADKAKMEKKVVVKVKALQLARQKWKMNISRQTGKQHIAASEGTCGTE